jgi:hypothetical protein
VIVRRDILIRIERQWNDVVNDHRRRILCRRLIDYIIPLCVDVTVEQPRWPFDYRIAATGVGGCRSPVPRNKGSCQPQAKL